MIVNKLLSQAWKRSRLLSGSAPDGDENNDALELLNILLQSKNAETYWPVSRIEISFDITAKSQYTIGTKDVQNLLVSSIVTESVNIKVNDATKFTVGDFAPIRINGIDYSFEITSILTTTQMVVDKAGANISIGDTGYIAPEVIPDIVSARPKTVDSLKYLIGDSNFPIKQKTLSTWDSVAVDSNNGGYPYQFRYLPNAPFGVIDFGAAPTSATTCTLSYSTQLDEVLYTTDLSELLPAEYISYLIWQLAYIISIDNGIPNLDAKGEAYQIERVIKMNNMETTELIPSGRLVYDVYSNRNIRR